MKPQTSRLRAMAGVVQTLGHYRCCGYILRPGSRTDEKWRPETGEETRNEAAVMLVALVRK